MGCVQSTGVDDEAKARKSHCHLLSSTPFRCFQLGLSSALLVAKATYIGPMFISVLKGTTDHFSPAF